MSTFIAAMLGSRFLADQNTVVLGEEEEENKEKTTKKTEEKDSEKRKNREIGQINTI